MRNYNKRWPLLEADGEEAEFIPFVTNFPRPVVNTRGFMPLTKRPQTSMTLSIAERSMVVAALTKAGYNSLEARTIVGDFNGVTWMPHIQKWIEEDQGFDFYRAWAHNSDNWRRPVSGGPGIHPPKTGGDYTFSPVGVIPEKMRDAVVVRLTQVFVASIESGDVVPTPSDLREFAMERNLWPAEVIRAEKKRGGIQGKVTRKTVKSPEDPWELLSGQKGAAARPGQTPQMREPREPKDADAYLRTPKYSDDELDARNYRSSDLPLIPFDDSPSEFDQEVERQRKARSAEINAQDQEMLPSPLLSSRVSPAARQTTGALDLWLGTVLGNFRPEFSAMDGRPARKKVAGETRPSRLEELEAAVELLQSDATTSKKASAREYIKASFRTLEPSDMTQVIAYADDNYTLNKVEFRGETQQWATVLYINDLIATQFNKVVHQIVGSLRQRRTRRTATNAPTRTTFGDLPTKLPSQLTQQYRQDMSRLLDGTTNINVGTRYGPLLNDLAGVISQLHETSRQEFWDRLLRFTDIIGRASRRNNRAFRDLIQALCGIVGSDCPLNAQNNQS